MNSKICILGLILFIFEIAGTILYAIGASNSGDSENYMVEQMKKNFEENKITYTNINRYYYLLEFKKFFYYSDSKESFERISFHPSFLFVFYFAYFMLILINYIMLCKNGYKDVKYISFISLIISLSFFIYALLNTYKVNMPEKEIYVFDDETNDEIRKKLTNRRIAKIQMVVFSIMIIVTFIIHIIFAEYLRKKETKKEEINIISPIIKEDNDNDNDKDQDNQINLKDINEPIIN